MFFLRDEGKLCVEPMDRVSVWIRKSKDGKVHLTCTYHREGVIPVVSDSTKLQTCKSTSKGFVMMPGVRPSIGMFESVKDPWFTAGLFH